VWDDTSALRHKSRPADAALSKLACGEYGILAYGPKQRTKHFTGL
jgi:hypothetical protein